MSKRSPFRPEMAYSMSTRNVSATPRGSNEENSCRSARSASVKERPRSLLTHEHERLYLKSPIVKPLPGRTRETHIYTLRANSTEGARGWHRTSFDVSDLTRCREPLHPLSMQSIRGRRAGGAMPPRPCACSLPPRATVSFGSSLRRSP